MELAAEQELSTAWDAILAEFGRRTVPSAGSCFEPKSLGVVRCAGASELLIEVCVELVRADIDSRLIPAFWARFAPGCTEAVSSARQTQCALFVAVHELVSELTAHAYALQALECQLLGVRTNDSAEQRVEQLLLRSYSLLLVRVPPELDFASLVVAFWSQSFEDYCTYLRLYGELPAGLLRADGASSAGADEPQLGASAADDEDEDGGEEEARDGDALKAAASRAELELVAQRLLPPAHAQAVARWVCARAAAGGGGGGAMDVEAEGGADQAARSSREHLELVLGAFSLCCAQLSGAGWLAQLEERLGLMLCARVHAHVHERCAGRFETRLLARVLRWLSTQLLPWLRAISAASDAGAGLGRGRGDEERDEGERGGGGGQASFASWHARLRLFVHETLGLLRIAELFDVIRDFPESSAALEDLAVCLRHTHQHSQLVGALRAALEQRLLRPGAHTAQVLELYVGTIKALHLLDPSGVLLQRVSGPVCEYLQRRTDTVRQIVAGLSHSGSGSELAEALGVDDGAALGFGPDADPQVEGGGPGGASLLECAQRWVPLPAEGATPSGAGSRQASRAGDVLSSLMRIYGSSTVFVAEYRSMLAEKVLGAQGLPEAETDRERRKLEGLKVRFGEAALHSCDIMLKDLVESKRVQRAVCERAPPSAGSLDEALGVTILSRLSWPPLAESQLRTHPLVHQALARYGEQYAHLKSPRKLAWKTALGSVTLELELGGRALTAVVCSPAQATAVLHFADRERWPLPLLAQQMQLEPAALRSHLGLWLNRGLLVEVEGEPVPTFELAVSLGASGCERAQPEEDEGAADSQPHASAAQDAEESLHAAFITNMLTNLGALSLSRIHNMLKMFIAEPVRYDKTEQQLNALLMRMVEEEKLELVGGQFSLKQ